jgi:phosphatidylcholine synthase
VNAANASAPRRSAGRVALAWGVHVFTASGAVIAAVALLAIMQGDFATAGILMLAALFIDSVDGTMARRIGVASLIPRIDGRRLDDVVDFLGYAIVPSVFMVATGVLPHWGLAAVPIFASAYGFSQTEAKTEDDFFLGWPSYWNVVALYLWLLEIDPGLGTALVVGFAAAIFAPLKYIYPSKLAVWRRATIVGGLAWGTCIVAILLLPETRDRLHLVELSLLYPAYYMGLSAWLGGWLRPQPTRRP